MGRTPEQTVIILRIISHETPPFSRLSQDRRESFPAREKPDESGFSLWQAQEKLC
jgi:hypothetical protein